MRLEDMRLFALVVEAGSFTGAARRAGVPKQTLSRRIAELEAALDVQLLQRTTRRLHLTDVGAAYAARCAEVIRLADEANQAVTDTHQAPRGTLRITADPTFGEAFLPGLIVEYAKLHPEVELDVLLTRRKVDLLEEGFEVAFRIGQPESTAALTGQPLGPARVRYCASPSYVRRRGRPKTPDALRGHDCILVVPEGTAVRWPFRGADGDLELRPVTGRLRFNSFTLAHQAALAGLGIALYPEFACAEDLRRKRLVTVLGDQLVEVGAVCLVHPTRRYLSARVRTFLELATARLGGVIAPA